jgi:PhzF family phenazine biosynthesis protein
MIMKIPLFQIDAFADRLFHGNPASVCPLEQWIPDSLMQQIAMENNQAETAFFVRNRQSFEIRWFTPTVEVELCGHATLAAAFVIFNFMQFRGEVVKFSSRSGPLSVTREGGFLTLDFPVDRPVPAAAPDNLIAGIGLRPSEILKGKTDFLLVFSTEEEIKNLDPDMSLISKAEARGIITTAPGYEADFVSRFFAPQSGIPEDPVTGSAHTTLTPFWAARLGRNELTAMQLSKRRGWLKCRLAGDRVLISGQARAYMAGEVEVDG